MIKLRIDQSLKADFTWVFSGNAIYAACQWAIVMLLAKLGTPADVGEYALGMALCAPVVTFANFQLRALLASDVRDEYSFSRYLTFRLAALGLALVVIVGIVAATQSSWRLAAVILLVGLGQIFEGISDIFYGLVQKFDRMDRLSTSLMTKGLLSVAALGVGMYLTRSVLTAVMCLALARLLVLLCYDSRVDFKRRSEYGPVALRLEWDSRGILRLLHTALPLGIIYTLGSLNGNIPRYFIEAHCGTHELGIYSAIASLLSAGNLITQSFGQSVFVPIARACANNDRNRYRTVVLQLVCLGSLLGAAAVTGAAFLGRGLLAVLFRPEYADHVNVFVRLMVVAAITYIGSGQGYIMTAARSLNPQIAVQLCGGLASIAACAWLIPRQGIEGAANAAIAAALVQLAGASLILLRIDRRFRGLSQLAFAPAGPGK